MLWRMEWWSGVESGMARSLLYTGFGYLCGSILFARLFGMLLRGKDITQESVDGNPGTANAFLYGGFLCGILTLCGDLLKGFLPVWMYLRRAPLSACQTALIPVMAAPVIGHLFPLFGRIKGGKGIAVTFGCLLGLAPELRPVLILAFVFIFLSAVVRVTPHYDRTIWTYRCVAAGMLFLLENRYIAAAFLLISLAVNGRMHLSDEKREKCQVKLLWMR